MAQVRSDSKTGQHWVLNEGLGEWEPVSREEAQAADRGFAENVGREIGAQAVDAVGFGLDALQAPFSSSADLVRNIQSGEFGTQTPTLGEDLMASNDPAQQARMAQAPGAAWAGIGASLLMPGAPQARTAARAAGGALNKGTQRGLEIGNAVVAGNTARAVGRSALNAAEQLPMVGPLVKDVAQAGARTYQRGKLGMEADRSLSAAQAAPKRFNPGLMTSDEVADFIGPYNPERMHPAMRAKLDATDSQQYQDARDLMKRTEAFESQTGGGRFTDSASELKQLTNQTFMREIGADPYIAVSKENLGENLTRISSELNQIRGKSPVDVDGLATEIKADMADAINLPADAERAVDKALQQLDEMSENGLITQENAGVLENRLTRAIISSSGKPDTVVADVLGEVKDRIRARVNETLTPDQVDQEKALRRQWGLTMSGLNRQAAVGPDGLNIKSYLGSKGTKDRMTKTGRSSDPLVKFLRTMDEMTGDLLPSSGTSERLGILDQMQ